MSMQTSFPSEYTRMILIVTDKEKQVSEPAMPQEVSILRTQLI